MIVAEGDDKERVILAVQGKTAPLPPRPARTRTAPAACRPERALPALTERAPASAA